MKKIIYLLIVIFISLSVSSQHKHSTFYYQRTSLFDKPPQSTDDILFLGNSLTNGGEWINLLENKHVKNRGVSGDICEGVYDRLEGIINGKPAKVFLLIGINDLGIGSQPES